MERSIVGLVEPAASPFFLTRQSSPVQARASPGLASVPASVVLRASLPVPQQISFSSSPDPPASGPASSDMTPTSRSHIRAHTAAPPSEVGSAAAGPSRSRRRNTRKTRRKPDAEENSTASAASDEAVRRSTRNRKRPPVASLPAAAVSTREDPPAKRAKRSNLKKPPPGFKKDDAEDSKLPAKGTITASCCICMEEPKPEDLASIKGCDHVFCFDCIEKWSERENTCPLCKVRFTKIDRVKKAKKKTGQRTKNTKRVKQKDQRSDLAPGAALEGLLASFASSATFPHNRMARLIFSGMGESGNPFIQSAAERAAAAVADSDSMQELLLPDGIEADDIEDDDDNNVISHPAFYFPTGSMRVGGRPQGRQPTLGHFLRAMPAQMGSVGATGRSASMNTIRQMSLGSFDPPPPVRNYASNSAEQGVGRATNPLVIEDSDDDDDDVEVVQVRHPRFL